MMNILIPIDFSPCSVNALRFAIKLAKDLEARITVLHAYHIPVATHDLSQTVDLSAYEGYEDDCLDKYRQLEESLPEIKEVESRFVVEMGLLRDVIDLLLEGNSYDFVVTGTSGTSGLLKTLFGSNSLMIASLAACPVISVPQTSQSFRLQNIVYATDLKSPGSISDLGMLKRLAELYHAKVYLLHISKDPSQINNEESLEALELEGYFKDINHEFCFLSGENAEEEILHFVDKFNADLLAMRPEDHHWLVEVFGKSHTKKVLDETKIPVMTIHK